MNNELMVLLGCGLAAYAVTNACTSMYEKAEESDSDNEYEGFSCGGYHEEGYGGCGSYQQPAPAPVTQAMTTDKFAIDYYQEPMSAPPAENVSPLMFGTMVNNEPYIESDYVEMKDYTNNPDQIKVYNEKDDTIGLPITDMTEVSAGENNKYIYDRTIGTIGFTSTKIGGRFRGQGDFIRGDLGIVPDKTGWFQVPSDPANKLVLGAMNVSNGIGSSAPARSGAPKGAGFAMGGAGARAKTLDEIREEQSKEGKSFAMGGAPPRELTALDIIQAGYLQNKQDAEALGTSYTAGNPF